jgi:hypothetical protein
MTIDERIADLRAALRREAVDDLLNFAGRMRMEADREAVLEEASCVFADAPAALEFLKALSPPLRSGFGGEADGPQRFSPVRAAGDVREADGLQTPLTPTDPQPNPDRQGGDTRAQRFARVRVAEIQLYHAAQIKTGRATGDIYGALRAQMDAAREAYREKFLTPVNGTADYLHAEFVRTLANDDAALLGPTYPGPLV